MRVDTKYRENVITDVNNKPREFNINMIDNGNLDRSHLSGKGLHFDGKGMLLYVKNLTDGIQKLWCKEKMSKECMGHNFWIPRKNICHDDFNSILASFNSQCVNIVDNNFKGTNINSATNNLNKNLENTQRDSEIEDLTDKNKFDLSGLIKLRKEEPNNSYIAYLNISSLRKKLWVCEKYVLKFL